MVHVLDDLLFVGQQASTQCSDGLNSFMQLCAEINIPINQDKTVLPSTILPFLGIELDSEAMQARLPEDKVAKIRELLAQFTQRRKVTLQELHLC